METTTDHPGRGVPRSAHGTAGASPTSRTVARAVPDDGAPDPALAPAGRPARPWHWAVALLGVAAVNGAMAADAVSPVPLPRAPERFRDGLQER